jgi:hypothetical protein
MSRLAANNKKETDFLSSKCGSNAADLKLARTHCPSLFPIVANGARQKGVKVAKRAQEWPEAPGVPIRRCDHRK